MSCLVSCLGCIDTLAAENELLGRCYMDSCSWSKELSRDFVGASANGVLYKLVLVGGTSNHPNGQYQMKRRIIWNKEPHIVFVFCSKKFPATLIEGEPKMQVDFLSIGEGVPGALESSLSLYMFVCHNISRGDERLLRQYSYAPSIDSFNEIESTLIKPTDILLLR